MIPLTVNRKLTTRFIDDNPVDIVLIPRVSEPTPSGGRQKTQGAPRQPQRVTLLEPSDSGYRGPSVIGEGSQESFDFMLVGQWDMQINKDDVFVHRGKEYKVSSLMIDNDYEKRALVVRHGW